MKRYIIIIFPLLVFNILCQNSENNCLGNSNQSHCIQNKNCEWIISGKCISNCTKHQNINSCKSEKNCSWINQIPARCQGKETGCPMNADISNCNSDYCIFTQKCFAHYSFFSSCSNQSEESSCKNNKLCQWSTDGFCSSNYILPINQRDKERYEHFCSGEYRKQQQWCDQICYSCKQQDHLIISNCRTYKNKQECQNNNCYFSKGKQLCTDINCSTLTSNDCIKYSQCQLTDICSLKSQSGCKSLVKKEVCESILSLTEPIRYDYRYCKWTKCKSSEDYCEKNCDKNYCEIETKCSNDQSQCLKLNKDQCLSDASKSFCEYIDIIPGFCQSSEACSLYNEQICSSSELCYYEKEGSCQDLNYSQILIFILIDMIIFILF